MLILTAESISDVYMTDYSGYASQDDVKRLKAVARALDVYGFDWPNEELAGIANGTSELFEKRDGNEDEDDDD